jgi:hypothetical protein
VHNASLILLAVVVLTVGCGDEEPLVAEDGGATPELILSWPERWCEASPGDTRDALNDLMAAGFQLPPNVSQPTRDEWNAAPDRRWRFIARYSEDKRADDQRVMTLRYLGPAEDAECAAFRTARGR